MLKNYFKIAVRNIWRNKVNSVINITGFALGMACTILIMLWVQEELSFDQFNANKKNIYRVVCDWARWEWEGFDGTPEPLGQKAVDEIPEVQNMFRIASMNRQVFRYDNTTFYEEGGIIADPSIFDVMSFPLIEGDLKNAFAGPDYLIISELLAKKYFGNLSPISKTIFIDGSLKTITGVFKDIPQNSQISFTYMFSFEFIDRLSNWGRGWNAFNYVTYLMLNDNPDLIDVGNKLTEIGKNYKSHQVVEGVTFRLQPLVEVYLKTEIFSRNFQRRGNISYVFIFSIVAGLVLLIACINFMNLSTAQSMSRSIEIGLRKTIGAQRSQLMKQFLLESILLAFIAHIIAMIIVELFIPTFNQIAGKNINTDYLDIGFVVTLFTAVLFTGLIAGFYPAMYLSGFSPISVLRKAFSTGSGSTAFRKSLVVIQFTFSIALIIGTSVISKQISFMSNKKLGFNKENILFIPMEENIPGKYEVFKSSLMNDPAILSVTGQRYNFIETAYRSSGFTWEGMNPNRERPLDLIYSGIDYNYFEMLELPLVEGRSFTREISSDAQSAIILNEAAIKDMEMENPIGKWFDFGNGEHTTIIGVANDVHIRTLKQEIEPRVFYITDLSNATEGLILIKIDGAKTVRAISHIEKVWNEINPVTPFEFNFLDESYNNLYKSEYRTRGIFNYFTILAILISSLGLFGLASFSAEKRIKEIGVRKVMGASVYKILLLLVKDFSKWVLIANIFAWPIAYYFAIKILENYAYKTSISLDIFIISGGTAFLIAVFTVSYKSIKAALSNPIEALRYE